MMRVLVADWQYLKYSNANVRSVDPRYALPLVLLLLVQELAAYAKMLAL